MGKFLLWVVILVIGVNACGSLGCLDEERIALLHLKAHIMNNTYGNYLASWVDDKRSDCCGWSRVKCSDIMRKVISLRLSSVRDKRVGNWYINATVFLPFKYLNSLTLSNNNLIGTLENEGFDILSKLHNLKRLDLSFNNLKRSSLSSLSHISSLKELYLNDNPLDSPPNKLGHEKLSRLNNLEILTMRSTKMKDDNVLSALKLKDFISLKELYINGSNFQSFGPINDGEGAMKLERLYLHSNRFNNTILKSLKGLPSLKFLDLSRNDFNRPLQIEDINALSNLEELDLSDNLIEGFEASTSFSGLSSGGVRNKSCLQVLHLNNIMSNMTKLLQPLITLPSIKTLHLQENNITSIDAINALRNLGNLEELFLDNSNVHKDFLQSIGSMNLLKLLSLRGVQFGGTLPNKGWCELRNLQELRFSDNQLEGTLPSCMKNLTSLRLVDLSLNKLIGNIDSSPLSALVSLEYLSISNNSFEVPTSFKSFANHSKLRFILADGNKAIIETELQSVVPKFQLVVLTMSECNGLSKLPGFLHFQHDLEVLKITRNNLGGDFPNWLLQNNTKLRGFIMSYNAFTGTLKMPSQRNFDLEIFDVSKNQLSGEIPNNLSSSFPNIGSLNLSYNLFKGQIPSNLGNLEGLGLLDLSNNSLTGKIPKEMLIGFSFLWTLKLSNNKLQGEIVQEFEYLSWLKYLYLDGNNFSGTILDSFSSMPLHIFDISDNKISGEIPRWMGHITSLEQLSLSKNHLKGSIPVELCYLGNLSVLDLSENNLTGSIPSCLNSSFIKYVGLSKNHLGGELTRAFFNNRALVIFDLSYNDFVGTIPEWIGSISKLSILSLKGNQFEGTIPMQICQLMRLSILDLSNNRLSGPIPQCLVKLSLAATDKKSKPVGSSTYAFVIELSPETYYNSFRLASRFLTDYPTYGMTPEVEFRTKGNLYYYRGIPLEYMSGIDLSDNMLIGEIPFNKLGNITEMRALNLSHNNLSGTIPETLSMLHNIESIDLSYNKLNGKIPNTLLKLNTLAVFRVAYNNLTGAIPKQSAQFATFDESSYQGNPYLCGPPLHVNCSSLKSPLSPLPSDSNDDSEESDGIDLEVFYISFGVSYVVILITIGLVLYINPYWRNKWFEIIEVVVYKCFGRGM